MSLENRRFMRIIVFFDLPTVSKSAKRAYVLFRRFLINDGYDMLQWSIYSRIVNGVDDRDKHIARLEHSLPEKGAVRCLTLTEKQYASMKILVGTPKAQEKRVKSRQLSLF